MLISPLLALALSAAPAAAAPVTYALDPIRSELLVLVYKDPDTLASGMSHNHVIRASAWQGTVVWDPEDPSACQVSFTVPVQQLVVDEPHLRVKVHFELQLSDDQKADVKKNMLSSGQLDAKKYPEITFQSTSCGASATMHTVVGNLTIHGKSKVVAVPMTISADDTTFMASGAFTAKATDFGFEPYSALLGQLKNKDVMDFKVTVKGNAK